MEELIKKFWNGKANSEEKKMLYELLRKSDNAHFQKLKEVFDLNEDSIDKQKLEDNERFHELLKELHKKIEARGKKKSIKILPIKKWAQIAAVFLFVLTIGGLGTYLLHSKIIMPSQFVNNDLQTVENFHSHKIMQVDLIDGSNVFLYPNSKITYSNSFGLKDRKIQLVGKGTFKVAKDPDLPFIVEAKNYTTTALGTIFSVDAISAIIKIALHEGKIVVASTSKSNLNFNPIYLIPNQQITIHENSGKFSIAQIKELFTSDLQDEIRVIQNSNKVNESKNTTILKFKMKNLADVLDELSNHYKKQIVYTPSEMEGVTFTGEIHLKENLMNTIQTLCYLNSLKYTVEEDKIRIHR